MKITGKGSQGVQNADTIQAKKTDGLKKANVDGKSRIDAGEVAGSAKLNVSERAQMMQKAKDIASQQTVDEAKVARLQKLIDEGKYKVDAQKVADKLVDEQMNFPE